MRREKLTAFLNACFGACAALLIVAITFPAYTDYTSRSRAAEMIALASPIKERLSRRIAQLHSVQNSGIGISTDLPSSSTQTLKDVRILQDGSIVLLGAQHGQLILLIPSLSQDTVTWLCLGGPAKDVPSDCRSK